MRFDPARRAGPDAIVGIVLVHTVKEKFEVNFCFKNVINLTKTQKGLPGTAENVQKLRSH